MTQDPKVVLSEEQQHELVEKQHEKVAEHLTVVVDGLAMNGMFNTVIAWTLVEMGLHQMFNDWIEGLGEMEVDEFTDLIKSKLNSMVADIKVMAVNQKAELLLAEQEPDATQH